MLWSDKENWNKTKELFPNLTKKFEQLMTRIIDEN